MFKREKKTPPTIGSLLIDMGFITRDQLRDAITKKLASSGEQLLGEVLIAQGMITRSQLDRALLRQRTETSGTQELVKEASKLLIKTGTQWEKLDADLEEVSRQLSRVGHK